jgi:prevent-host-death family protein
MRKVNIDEAKTTLAQLVEAAENGETIVLARAGKPVAKLVRYAKPAGIQLGMLKGRMPAGLVAQIERPFTRDELASLFGAAAEPTDGDPVDVRK